jgi:hypothetical protein
VTPTRITYKKGSDGASYQESGRGLYRKLSFLEIGLVVVMVGLVMGGVLKGRQLIEISRVNKAVRDMSSIAAAVLSYQDRYGAKPGDDGPIAILTARGANWAGVTAGDNDNGLEVPLNTTFSGVNEGGAFWQHLRAAGFLHGDPTVTGHAALPKNPWGGLFGVTTGSMAGGLIGTKVCQSQINGAAALTIDQKLDDGVGYMGVVRATLGIVGSNTNPMRAALIAAYSADEIYTVCLQL